MSFRFLKIKYIITLLKNKNIMFRIEAFKLGQKIKALTFFKFRNLFHEYDKNITFNTKEEKIELQFSRKEKVTQKKINYLSDFKRDFLVKTKELFNLIIKFIFFIINYIKEKFLFIKDKLYIQDITKRTFDYINHDIRIKKESQEYISKSRFLITKRMFFDRKLSQASKISISDLSVNEKVYNKDYINLKTDQYERTTRIKEFLVFVIGGIIGALCVCFGWMATILLEAWQKNDIMYLFDKKNYISYMMTALFIIAMIALLYIQNKYLDKTGIIADIDKIMGIKNDPSACWNFIDGDKFKTRFLGFLKNIMDDNLYQKIVLLKKNFGEIYNDLNIYEDLYNDKKIEIQNRILSVLKESDFSPDDKKILTLATNQIHQIFEILTEYKNYTFVISKDDTREGQYDIGEFLRSLFSDLSKPHQNLNFDSSGKIIVNGVSE